MKRSDVRFTIAFLLVTALGPLITGAMMSCERSETNGESEQPTSNTNQTSATESEQSNTTTTSETVSEAKRNYQRYCAACHGENGKGNGPAAEYLYPKPRNLYQAKYKFTSTPSGELPMDADLHRTIAEGLPGTGMPGFSSVLDDEEIDGLVQYLKNLSPRFEHLDKPKPISVPEPPEPTEKLISKGKQLYQQNACFTCHGNDGSGDGPTANSLTDARGNPIQPRDFTKGVYKRGSTPKDIYRSIVTGIPGTGMPSYASSIPNETDRWALVHYIRSLSESTDGEPDRPRFNGDETLTIKRGRLPDGPTDPAWNERKGVQLGTFPLWKRPEPAPVLTVKAMHNGETGAFLFTWNDATKNTQDLKQRSFTDAAALQVPANTSAQPPFHGMGDLMDDGKVRILHWKAVRASGKKQGEPVDLDVVYEHMYADRYRGEREKDPSQTSETRPEDKNLHDLNPEYQSAVDVGNPLASRELAGRSVLEYVAEGFGSLTAVPPGEQRATAQSTWSQGTWRIMIKRPLSSDAKDDPSLTPGTSTWIGFALFDGHFNERNGKKSVTQWIRLDVEK